MDDKKTKINTENLDTATRPQEDFFQYANGGWLTKNEIPADQAKWGSFYELDQNVQYQLKTLLEEFDANPPEKGSEAEKVLNFYKTGMNEEKINKDGAAPLWPILEKIKKIEKTDLSVHLAELHRYGFTPLFRVLIGQDEKEASAYIPFFWQEGLGMPDRDYYLKDDEKSAAIQTAYKNLIKKLLGLLGYTSNETQSHVEDIYAFETKLAAASVDKVDLRDPYKRYFKKNLEVLTNEIPLFSWKEYFETLGIPENQSIILSQPTFFAEVAKLCTETDIAAIRMYLVWQILRSSVAYLSDEFVNTSFEFYGKTLVGMKELKPRWKRVLSATNQGIGFAVGKMYVEKYFSKNAKKKMTELVANILEAMRERIKNLPWMTEATKENAFKKLATFLPKLGYPENWQKYSTLVVGNSYLENVMLVEEFEIKRSLAKLGSAIDRTEWLMTPQMVNAYYQPPMNEIVFPAAILQPPFFSEFSEDALNYGGIGSVIAHEITHGFDDEGSEYDETGNLRKWWTEEDRKKFDERTKVIVEQFDSIFPIPEMHINGKLTLGENIADLGGVLLAYDAYMKSLEGKETPPVIDGLSHIQRFFLRFAECECGKARPEMLRQQLIVDPHSPSKYRVNAILQNVDAFYDAFAVTEKDSMFVAPEKRARIW